MKLHQLLPLAFLVVFFNCSGGKTGKLATVIPNEVASIVNPAHFMTARLAGYGLYADLDGNTVTDMDDWRGHHERQRGYHYHLDKVGSNNFINCLRGAYANQPHAH
jgi:hypothetical protein